MDINTTNTIYIILTILIVLLVIDNLVLKPKIDKTDTKNIIEKIKKAKPIKNNYKGKGIAVEFTDDYISNVFTVFSLRKVTNLPITCYYKDEENLSIFKKMKDITLKESTFQAENVLNSSYNEIIYIMSGVIFFVSPEYLFQNSDYQETGTVFWKCKTTRISNSLIKNLISYDIAENPILMKKSGNFTVPYLFVINKTSHINGLSVLNAIKDIDQIDDEEKYWVSFELANEDYYYIDNYKTINGADCYFIKDNLFWIYSSSPEDLDTNYVSPIDYFKNNNKPFTDEQQETINYYKKIYHDLVYSL